MSKTIDLFKSISQELMHYYGELVSHLMEELITALTTYAPQGEHGWLKQTGSDGWHLELSKDQNMHLRLEIVHPAPYAGIQDQRIRYHIPSGKGTTWDQSFARYAPSRSGIKNDSTTYERGYSHAKNTNQGAYYAVEYVKAACEQIGFELLLVEEYGDRYVYTLDGSKKLETIDAIIHPFG